MNKKFYLIIKRSVILLVLLSVLIPTAFATGDVNTEIGVNPDVNLVYKKTNFWDWLVSLSDTDSKTSATDEQTNYTNSFGGSGTGRKVESYSSASGYKIPLDSYGWWYEVTESFGSVVGQSNQMKLTATSTSSSAFIYSYGHVDFTLDRDFVGKLIFPKVTETYSGGQVMGDRKISILSSTDGGASYSSIYSAVCSVDVESSDLAFTSGVKYRLTFSASPQWGGTATFAATGSCYLIGYFGADDVTRMNVNVTDSDGAIGAIDGNGNTVSTEVKYLFDESTNTVYNTSTGGYDTASNYEYNYEDRSYTVTTTSGDTMTITYGDENITYTYAPVSGDTITNNYYYLIQDDTPTTSTVPSASPSTDPGTSTGDTIWDKLASGLAAFFSAVGKIIGGILTGLVALATKVVEALGNLGTLFKGLVENALSIGSGFIDLLTGLFGFIMTDDLKTVITLGVVLLVGACVFKMFIS